MELLRGDRDVLVVGHRGAAALAPGNSLAAIEAAAAHGAHAVELDVLFGPGGGLVLAHDPAPRRRRPSLDDGLALAARLGLAVQLDLKAPGVEAGAAAALRRHALLDRSFVSSPLVPVLAELRRLEPALARALTYPDDRYGVSHRRLLRPVVRPGLALMRALLPRRIRGWLEAADAQAATLNWAVVTQGRRRRVPRRRGGGLRLDGERRGARENPRRNGRRRYHHRRSAAFRPGSNMLKRAGLVLCVALVCVLGAGAVSARADGTPPPTETTPAATIAAGVVLGPVAVGGMTAEQAVAARDAGLREAGRPPRRHDEGHRPPGRLRDDRPGRGCGREGAHRGARDRVRPPRRARSHARPLRGSRSSRTASTARPSTRGSCSAI